jgi:hypothetical protein
MKKLFSLLMLVATCLVGGTALAHGNTKPLHGGIMQMVGETSFELVAKPEGAELYVVDDGEDIASAQMTAKLTIDIGGTKSEVAMQPAGGNKFEAKGAKIPSGAKVAVLLVGPNEVKTTARFTIK